MSKKKREEPWGLFVSRIFKRKRAKNKIILPTAYLLAVADNLHKMNPTKEIIYNTLKEVASICIEKGYYLRQQQMIKFKSQQEKHAQEDWNKVQDELDDMIHEKNKA